MLFVGDDWAEDHHDVEIVDSDGKRLGRARLPEGMAGMTRLHAMIASTSMTTRWIPRPGCSRWAGWWSGSRPTAARG